MTGKTEINRLIQNAKDCFDGKPWYGTSLMDILDGIPFAHVNSTPEGFEKSIVTLLQHMIAWREFMLKKLGGQADYKIPEESILNWNFEPISDEKRWMHLIDNLKHTQVEYIAFLKRLTDDDLDEQVAGSSYSTDYLIRGITQHDTFHLGQIALLKRALERINSGS